MKFLPQLATVTLENGLRIFVVERPEQPSVEIQFHVETGSIHEGADLGCGLSHFLEHMLFQGCRNYPGTAAADAVSALGGDMNAYTSFDQTVYHAEVPADQFEKAVDVLAMMVRYPEFPDARFAAEREVILRECDLGRDNPDRRLMERLWTNLYRVHPAGVPIIGFPEKIADVSREKMAAYYQARYAPGRTFIVAVGAVKPQALFDAVAARLGDWARERLDAVLLPEEPETAAVRMADYTYRDPLARLGVGMHLPAGGHADIPALDLAAGILGMSDASRLVRKLRLEEELALQIECFAYVQPFGGVMGILSSAQPGKFARLEKALYRELTSFRHEGISGAELRREKNQQLAEQLRLLRSNHGIAATVAGSIHQCGAPYFFADYLERLERLTLDEANAAIHRWVDPDKLIGVRQLPESNGRSVHKNAAPASGLRAHEYTSPGGVRSVWVPDASLPLVDLSLVLPGGAIFECPDQDGISRLLCNLLTTGSGCWSEAAVAEKFESLGATLHCSAGLNSLGVKGNVPRRNFRRFLDFLLEVLAGARFDERAFERERANQLDELQSRMEQPRFVAERQVAEMLYGSHPYARGLFGRTASLSSLTAADVRTFYRQSLVPSQLTFGLGGDLREEEFLSAMSALDAALPWQAAGRALPPEPVFPQESGHCRIALPRDQTVVLAALPVGNFAGDANLATAVLGEAMNGLSSRLFKLVREDHALAYSTGMRLQSGFHRGMAVFFAMTAPDQAEKALDLLRQEIDRIGRDGLSSEEFAEARRGAVFSLERAAAEPGSLLGQATLSRYYAESAEELRRDIARLEAFDAAEVNALLKPYFVNPPCQTAIVGNGGE